MNLECLLVNRKETFCSPLAGWLAMTLFCVLFFSGQCYGETRVAERSDTLIDGIRTFDPVIIIGNFSPMSYEEHWRLKSRVEKVWPYAELAAQYLREMDSLQRELSKRKFKKEVSLRQKQLFDNFSGILKKFSRAQGRVLIKLIYRQTGISTYDIAKELKSGFRAFWWNTSASLFSLSLKDEYDPQTDPEDYNVEVVLRELFREGKIKPRPSFNDYTSPFYYRKIEQDIARDRQQAEETEKINKERERQLRKAKRIKKD